MKNAAHTITKAVSAPQPPEIYNYEDPSGFLKDWIAFLKHESPGFSLKPLAERAQISISNLSMILSGNRKLSFAILDRLSPYLQLTSVEISYLRVLIFLKSARTQEEMVAAYAQMNSFRRFREKKVDESAMFRYLTHWYYVAVREMSSLEDFTLDAKWVQAQLVRTLPLAEVERVVKFLVDQKFIETTENGQHRRPTKSIESDSRISKLALSQFHREMLTLASQVMESTSREERKIVGFTLAVDQNGYDEIVKIIERAYDDAKAVAERSSRADRVYQMELALFPLTKIRST